MTGWTVAAYGLVLAPVMALIPKGNLRLLSAAGVNALPAFTVDVSPHVSETLGTNYSKSLSKGLGGIFGVVEAGCDARTRKPPPGMSSTAAKDLPAPFRSLMAFFISTTRRTVFSVGDVWPRIALRLWQAAM